MTHQPRESTATKILVPLIVVILGALLVGGSAPWWWKIIFPDETAASSPGPTTTPTSGSTISLDPGTPTPLPPTAVPQEGCVLTISNPFATIRAEPSHSSEEIGDVPAGEYATSDTRIVEFAGKDERWFEITASGRTGWIEYNNIIVESKSADCP